LFLSQIAIVLTITNFIITFAIIDDQCEHDFDSLELISLQQNENIDFT